MVGAAMTKETRGWRNHDNDGGESRAMRCGHEVPGSAGGAGYWMFITAATLGVPLASRANNM